MAFLPRGSAGGEISSHGMRLPGERARMGALSRNVRRRLPARGHRRHRHANAGPVRRRYAARASAGPQSWQTGGMSMTDPVTAPEATNRTVGEPCVLLKLGEIFLKGKNRQQFVRMQQANVRAAVRSTGVPVELTVREGVLVLRVAHGEGQAAERMPTAGHAEAMDRVAARVADVPG